METKVCNRCFKEFPATNEFFYKNKGTKYGLLNQCKKCTKDIRSARNRRYYQENKERLLAQRKQYYQEKRDLIRQKQVEYRFKNRDAILEANKRYYRENFDKWRESYMRWRKSERGRAIRRQWEKANREANPERVRYYYREYRKKWLFCNPAQRISNGIRALISNSLKGKKGGRSWQELVGYTLAELMAHLESKFKPGMSWDNYGQWHIDHIRPIASFNFTSPDDPEFRECWALENLQPLWAEENLRKGARLS